jgi:hypothetical protein
LGDYLGRLRKRPFPGGLYGPGGYGLGANRRAKNFPGKHVRENKIRPISLAPRFLSGGYF